MKDNFSTQAGEYVKFRPGYPDEALDYILSLVPFKDVALDCATGNGQVAIRLAEHFTSVFATDLSEAQISQAAQSPNITYKVERAEHSSFPAHSFDLVTVAQAIHWFDFDAFYKEVKRIGKPGSILAVLGYGLPRFENAVDSVVDFLYDNILSDYWDKERKYVDENYTTIPCPLEEIPSPSFVNTYNWTIEQLVGFLNTWSAVQHYIKAEGNNPVDMIYPNLVTAWGTADKLLIKCPILLRVGKI